MTVRTIARMAQRWPTQLAIEVILYISMYRCLTAVMLPVQFSTFRRESDDEDVAISPRASLDRTYGGDLVEEPAIIE